MHDIMVTDYAGDCLKLDELTNAEVAWPLLKQRIDDLLGLYLFGRQRVCCHLLALFGEGSLLL